MKIKDALRYLAAFIILAVFWVTILESESFGIVPSHLIVLNIATIVSKSVVILIGMIAFVFLLFWLMPKHKTL